MTQLNRTSMIGAFLVAALAVPVAFAQDTAATAQQAPPTAEVTGEMSEAAAAPAATAEAGASTEKKSWADVDMDKDGALTKAEAGAVPALGSVFDKADANADGSLTADEYKAYVAASKGGETGDKGQGGSSN